MKRNEFVLRDSYYGAPNVCFAKNFTWKKETYDNHENQDLIPFFLNLVSKLLQLLKPARLNYNPENSLYARRTASAFFKWRRHWSPCLPVRYCTMHLTFWKTEKFRIFYECTWRQENSHCNLTEEYVACAKGFICHSVILKPYHHLLYLVPSRNGPIPKPKTASMYDMAQALAFTNELFWLQICTGSQICYLQSNFQARNYCPPYWKNGFFANSEVCKARNSWILISRFCLQRHGYFNKWAKK